jgi:hypothetical protein
VLLSDDFNDAAARSMPETAPEDTRHRVRYDAGEYSVQRINTSATGLTTVSLPGTYADTTLAVDVRIVGDPTQRVVALQCRRRGGPDEEQYRFEIRPDAGRFRLLRFQASRRTVLTDWAPALAIQRDNATNRMQLGCVGARITASVNGVELVSVEDAALRSGELAISAGTLDRDLLTEGRFDNLVVTAP